MLTSTGDVIVADGDGVIVVSGEHTVRLARVTREIMSTDKQGCRRLYHELGMPLDFTVEKE